MYMCMYVQYVCRYIVCTMYVYMYMYVCMCTYYMYIHIGDGVILDRSVYSDIVFANVCNREGYITEAGK